jgi:hypothetical protein
MRDLETTRHVVPHIRAQDKAEAVKIKLSYAAANGSQIRKLVLNQVFTGANLAAGTHPLTLPISNPNQSAEGR